MMNHLALFWKDTRAIFYNARRRGSLLHPFLLISANLRIKLKQAYFARFKIEKHEERALGLLFVFPEYGVFTHLWREIFVREIYYFKSSTNSPNIIDAGTNIGIGILYFKTLYPNASITAFEADLKNFEWLSKNVEANNFKNVTLYNAAVSSEDGTATFYCEEKNVDKGGSLIGSLKREKVEYTKASIQVPTKRLSPFMGEPVDLLKLDIEGSEFDVIPEIQGKLQNVKEIDVEVHSAIGTKAQVNAVLDILGAHGFRCMIGDADLGELGFHELVRSDEIYSSAFLISAIRDVNTRDKKARL